MKTLSTLIFTSIMSFTFGFADAMAQPVNDLIENAIDLDSGPFPYSEQAVNFPEATYTGDATPNPCGIGVAGIWYKFTANAAGIVAAVMVNANSSIVIFFEGPENATSGAELTYVDQPSNPCDSGNSATLETEPRTTYYIYMKNATVSDVLINITPAMVPANDLVENATNLNGLEDFSDPKIVFQLASTTNDGGLIGCNTGTVKAVWYKFTAPIDGQVVAGIDTPMEEGGVIFFSAENENATSGADLTLVEQPTNLCEPNNLQSIIATEGTTYYLFAALSDIASQERATVSVNLSGILGIEENTIEGFAFYPNPVSSELNLSAKTTLEEVSIFNILGQSVYSEKVNSTSKSISLSFLKPGLYIMNVTSEGKSSSFKIIKK